MFRLLHLSFLLLSYILLMSGNAMAASSPWVKGHKSEVRLISASDTVGDSDELLLGLEFVMDPKWKIYWRSPGEAGQPPIPDWTNSQNLRSAEIQWPIPERFSFFGIETFGYKNRVVLPIKAKVNQPGVPVNADVMVDYLICDDICIPATVNLSLQLNSGKMELDGDDETIKSYLEIVPSVGENKALKIEDFRVDNSLGDAPVLLVSASSDVGFSEPDLMIEAPEAYAFDVPEITISEDGKFASLRSEANILWDPDVVISRDNVTLTLVDGDEGVEVSAASLGNILSSQPSPSEQPTAPIGFAAFLSMILLAVVGGLILNLMPCVLPVLSLKLMSMIGKSDKSRSEVRRSFFATALGIVFSFMVLAGSLIALKSMGAAIGWGIQFQQPLFVLALIAIILLFAANMFGWFEISMPSFLGRVGQSTGNDKSLGSDFMTGAFATLLATPCSAPFLGTAVSFALVQSATVILLIFFALGLGMALPYLVFMLFPGAIRFMPKPGNWMNGLRKVLALMLVATAVWLLTVLLAQLGWTSAYIATALSAGMLGILWFVSRFGRLVLPTAVLSAMALIVVPQLFGETVTERVVELKAPWVQFDQDKIADHVAAGKTVYVDVTADWCVTCKVNKAVVFASDDIKSAFGSDNLVAMSADWTRPNDEIAAYLKSFNRAGIPFNAVYSQTQPSGETLPELLTPGLVLQALEKAH